MTILKHPFGLRKFAAGFVLTLIALCASASTASAQIDPIKVGTYEFANVGVARGQLARLNVFYHSVFPPGPCAQDGTCRPEGSFKATLSFYECDGSVTVQNVVTLSPERGSAIVFSPTRFNADGRACARGSVTVEPDADGFLPALVPNVEVLDAATGQTSLLNPGAIAGFNPQPEPPGDFNFGLFNVVKGQTARLSASFVDMPDGFPPGPCRITLSFYSGDGELIGQSTQSLEEGKTVQFDMPTTTLPAGARMRIRASVHVETADGRIIPCVMPSVEVFADDTGRGAFFYPGAMIGSD